MTDEKRKQLREDLSKEISVKLVPDTILSDLDSMEIMSLAVGIEKFAGVEIAYGEISQRDTYSELEDLIAERSAQ